MIDLNLKGLINTTHAALPHLLAAAEDSERGCADVVNISSVAGRVARSGSGVYNLTKHGVGAFSESFRQEFADRKVRSTIIEPGAVDTELSDHIRDGVREQVTQALRRHRDARGRRHRRRDRLRGDPPLARLPQRDPDPADRTDGLSAAQPRTQWGLDRDDRRLRLRPRLVPRGARRRPGSSLVLDVRQRRGVRGSEYAWANAQRLQAALAEAGVGYSHLKELAPTTELRELQYREDARLGEGKRSRTVLAPEYVAPLHGGDPRPGRPGADRQVDRRQPGGAALRRARPRGLPPLADRGAAAARVGRRGRAPAAAGEMSASPAPAPDIVRRQRRHRGARAERHSGWKL